MACNSKVQMACIYSILTGEGNRTSPSSPGMCAPGDQLCPHCQWCMQEMPGASLGSPQDGNSLLRLVLHGPEAWGLGPSGGCWWEVRDKFWLLSGPLPTAVPRAMAAPPIGRWSGLQLSLPKEISGTSTREHLHGNANSQKAALCVWKLMYLKWTSPGIGRSHLEGMWGFYLEG